MYKDSKSINNSETPSAPATLDIPKAVDLYVLVFVCKSILYNMYNVYIGAGCR